MRLHSPRRYIRPDPAFSHLPRLWETASTRSNFYFLRTWVKKLNGTCRVGNTRLVTAIEPCIVLVIFEIIRILVPPADYSRLVQVCHWLVSITNSQDYSEMGLQSPSL